MNNKKKVGILGATGAVGQRFIQLLENHPQFEVTALAASENSAGKPYRKAVTWRMESAIPQHVGDTIVQECVPEMEVDFVLSALPSDQAKSVEPAFAQAGFAVVSNASTFRMHPDVPLMIPEINPDHSELIHIQRMNRKWSGFIVTNPNCVTIGMALPLKALQDAFGLSHVNAVTFQARSGAGYPGPPPELIDDNVLPYIGGEEEKVETEPKKILGSLHHHAEFKISSQCNRVNVTDGHFECLNVGFKRRASMDEVKQVLREFSGIPQKAQLYSAPKHAIWLTEDDMRPQPKLDRNNDRGMAVTVGRVRPCPLFDIRMAILSHNTIRGAAGAALLNAELLVHQGYI